ncbi:HNH endonuclease [Methylovirgula sp. 4M-Z18]|uniref:HNH endonuclease n=1 Tax=Methylovirgula sp. 4M-Z18 TaxID=2293567 RepID=UPI000E2EC303|nr:HNH endonuclease [Methylovirgula sp. 4M-Z18]RFB78539.1 HNH endonuclease [Methylovirgula sp. 4M-Z18]
MSQHSTLLLNADYQPLSYFPLSLVSWQDALRAVIRGRVTVVAEYDAVARSPSRTMRLPSVIALKAYQKAGRNVAFTRFNVYLRDRFSCQYCGGMFEAKGLTFDHVVPRSRGGATSWENIVAACHACNGAKGSRMDMRPRVMPRKPLPYELFAAGQNYPPNYLHESWVDYLYWDSEIRP